MRESLLSTLTSRADPDEAFTTCRTYIRVRPTTDAVEPDRVSTLLRKLHALSPTDDGGLFGGPEHPTIEMSLVTPAGRSRVDYLFTVENASVDTLADVLDTWFPRGYPVTTTQTSLQALLTGEPSTAAEAGPTNADTPATAAAAPDAGAGDGDGDGPTAGPPLAERSVAGMEVYATEDELGDRRTKLTNLTAIHEGAEANTGGWPLASVIATLAATDAPVVYQTLLRPLSDWSTKRDTQIHDLRHQKTGTIIDRLLDGLDPDRVETEPPDKEDLKASVRSRIDELEEATPRTAFAINTRAVAFADPACAVDPAAAIADLREAFTAVGHTTYEIDPALYATDSRAARRLRTDLATNQFRGLTRGRKLAANWQAISKVTSAAQPKIIADKKTAGSFCIIGGGTLSETARRAVKTKPTDRVPEPLPPRAVLDEFRVGGMRMGLPKNTNSDVLTDTDAIALRPAVQPLHVLFLGKSGAGKSKHGINALLPNHAATDGATIILEPKDGAFAENYCRAHYAEYGSLENIYRFEAHKRLPAAPLFDIERELEAGISREQAVQNNADLLEDLLRETLGREAYEQAFTSSRVIQAVTKALFDRVHGDDQFTLQDLQATVARMQDAEHAPPVSGEELRRELADLLNNSHDTFTEIMRAAARRLAAVATDSRVRPLFDYAPTTGAAPAAVERWDWRERLDENCVIILDMSELAPEPQRILTLVVLAQLWRALYRRHRERTASGQSDSPPLVNLHIEEASNIAASGLLEKFLKQGRSFEVSVSLSMQYLNQLEQVDEAAYREAINDVGTVLAGPVNHDPTLARRLTTSERSPDAVATRLRALQPGEWLCWLPDSHEVNVDHPFTVVSGDRPVGIEGGPDPLEGPQLKAYEGAMTGVWDQTRRHGLPVADRVPMSDTAAADEASATSDQATAGPTTADNPISGGITSTVGLTNRLPDAVTPAPSRDAFLCGRCSDAYPATDVDDLVDAVNCHHDIADVPQEALPTVQVGCTVEWADRDRSPYTDTQFAFMQLLYNARRQKYDAREFDIVHDDMERLIAYAGLDEAALTTLIRDGLVTVDTDLPHDIYSLTSDGREVIDAAHREGIVHGDDAGDLSESNFHVMMVEALRRIFHQWFIADADHPGVEVRTYYGVADGRLDLAVLDDAGSVVVAGEAERSNNDTETAALEDFDKMAACDPDRAVWVVPNRAGGHEIIAALHNAVDGTPRVPRTYDAENTALRRVSIDEPGFTDIYSIQTIQTQLDGGD